MIDTPCLPLILTIALRYTNSVRIKTLVNFNQKEGLMTTPTVVQRVLINGVPPRKPQKQTVVTGVEGFKSEFLDELGDRVPMKLYPYQIEGVKRIVEAQGRVILADDMGLGKCAEVLKALVKLQTTSRDMSVLIICPKVAFGVWQTEIDKWLGEESLVYTGTPFERQRIWTRFKTGGSGRFLITNYAQAGNVVDRKLRWNVIVVDEAHFIRNRKTKSFQNINRLRSQFALMLTGSPMVNGAHDFWTLLHLIHREQYRGFWDFADKHCLMESNGFGNKFAGIKDPAALRAELKPNIIRRTKKQVLRDLPPKIRQAIPIEITGRQLELYTQIAKEMIAEFGDDDFLLVPNRISQITRLRQILVTPALIGGPHVSAMFDALKENIEIELDAGIPSIVFTPFASALPLIERELRDIKPNIEFMPTIRGGMKTGESTARVAEFQNHPSRRKVLLCSLLVGSSYSYHCFSGTLRWIRLGSCKQLPG